MKNIREQIESNKIGLNAVAFSALQDARANLHILAAAVAQLTQGGTRPEDAAASWPEYPVDVRCSDGAGDYSPDKVEAAAANLASLLPAVHRYISEHNMLSALERCSGADSEMATDEQIKVAAAVLADSLNAAEATPENEVTVEFKKTKTHHKWIYRFKGEVLRTSERPDPFPFAFNYPCKDGSFSEWTFGQRPDSSQRKYNGEPKTYAVQGDINE